MGRVFICGNLNMKKVIAFIGDGGSGKSTMIRHLTGVSRNRIITLIKTDGSEVSVFTIIQSPQEPPIKILPQEFLEIIQRADAEYTFIALRIDAVSNRTSAPNFQAYLDILTSNGINVTHIFQLGRENTFSSDVTLHLDSFSPFNEKASQIKGLIDFF
jgi:energy-coupling factor transporter ATP-binding protein EcfA2